MTITSLEDFYILIMTWLSAVRMIRKAIYDSITKTGCVVTAEEHSVIGGLGSAVSEFLSENCPVPLTRIGTRDTFGESGDPDELFKKYGLTAEDIAEAAKLSISRKKE